MPRVGQQHIAGECSQRQDKERHHNRPSSSRPRQPGLGEADAMKNHASHQLDGPLFEPCLAASPHSPFDGTLGRDR